MLYFKSILCMSLIFHFLAAFLSGLLSSGEKNYYYWSCLLESSNYRSLPIHLSNLHDDLFSFILNDRLGNSQWSTFSLRFEGVTVTELDKFCVINLLLYYDYDLSSATIFLLTYLEGSELLLLIHVIFYYYDWSLSKLFLGVDVGVRSI